VNKKLVSKIPLAALFLLLLQFPFYLSAQTYNPPVKYQKILLQMASNFYTVVREGRIDLDSSLAVTCKQYKLSKILLITENIDNVRILGNCLWMDNGKADSVKQSLPRLHGTEHAGTLLLLGAFYAFNPDSKSQYLESINFLQSAKIECDRLNLTNWSANCSCLLGKCYFMLKNVPVGLQWFKKITDDKNLIANNEIQAKAWNYEGGYCPFLPNLVIFRIDCLKKALNLYQRLGDSGNQINTLMDMSELSYVAGKRMESQDAAQKSLAVQKTIGFPYQQFTYDLLAYLSTQVPLYAEELKLSLTSISYANETKDTLNLAHFYFKVFNAYLFLNNKGEAKKWALKSLTEYEKHKVDNEIYKLIGAIISFHVNINFGGNFLSLINNSLKRYPPDNTIDLEDAYIGIGNYYEGLKSYPSATKYYLLAEKLEEQNERIVGGLKNSYILIELGHINLLSNNLIKSRRYFLEALSKTFLPYTNKQNLANIYYNLYQIDSSLNNYKSAMRFAGKYAQYDGAVYNETENKQELALSIQYETLQREKRLQLLKAQNVLELQKETTTRRLSYGGFALLTVIIIAIYSRYYHNKKINRKLEIQKKEIDNQNLSLQQMNHKQKVLLTEKEWLLREVHHRVKNNLQIVMSLLHSQSLYLKDETALNAVLESQHRVQAMSLIHQKLYTSENSSTIYMPVYIHDLVDYLQDSFKTKQAVYIKLKIEPITLDVIKAVPLGLILNEIVTNALKHAFPCTENDKISIELNISSEEMITLIVTDNGHGLPADFNVDSSKSFGMILMKGLTEDLDGTFKIVKGNGTKTSVTFSNNAYQPFLTQDT
jgi:two-component sensor histidine kinase